MHLTLSLPPLLVSRRCWVTALHVDAEQNWLGIGASGMAFVCSLNVHHRGTAMAGSGMFIRYIEEATPHLIQHDIWERQTT